MRATRPYCATATAARRRPAWLRGTGSSRPRRSACYVCRRRSCLPTGPASDGLRCRSAGPLRSGLEARGRPACSRRGSRSPVDEDRHVFPLSACPGSASGCSPRSRTSPRRCCRAAGSAPGRGSSRPISITLFRFAMGRLLSLAERRCVSRNQLYYTPVSLDKASSVGLSRTKFFPPRLAPPVPCTPASLRRDSAVLVARSAWRAAGHDGRGASPSQSQFVVRRRR